ncbi:hypothetical protein GLYMA_12G060000v4 [Glycine max]|nr:hypothetical protein GLYMA_12G060000v4 [Glycine max]KAH1141845.1 hypothetical protein GYH30_032848 [Glycine max]
MYKSEKSPQGYEANARQHSSPRGNPVFPEKHVLSSSDKHVVELDHQEKTLSRSISKKTATQPATTISSPNATTATTFNTHTNTNALFGPNKTMTETVAKKPTPVHVQKPDAAHITSKIQDRTVSKPTEHHDHPSPLTVKTARNTSLSYAAPCTPPAKLPSVVASSTLETTPASVTPAPSSAPAFSGKNTSPTAKIWDKGVSMKEYLLNKLEPGEDEKALSQVISEAMSPRRTPGDAGVMEKVKEVVTSLLRTEEPTKYADMTTTATATSTTTPTRISRQSPVSTNASRISSQMSASTSASRPSSEMPASTSGSRSSSQIPEFFNAQQDFAVGEEENHGRILQTN